MKRIFVLLMVVCLLCGCTAPAEKSNSTANSQDSTIPTWPVTSTTPQSGTTQPTVQKVKGSWVTKDGNRYYLKPDGTYATTRAYYLNELQ